MRGPHHQQPTTERNRWNRQTQEESTKTRLAEDHLAIIGAMERLEQDWKDTKAFNTLYELVVGANLAY